MVFKYSGVFYHSFTFILPKQVGWLDGDKLNQSYCQKHTEVGAFDKKTGALFRVRH